MATRAKTIARVPWAGDRDVHICTWTGLLNGDDGDPLEMPGSSDRSVQVTGTYGAAGNLRLEGSNDGVNYVVLTDPQGGDLDIVAADKQIEQLLELTRYVRPRVTAGDGTTNLVVTMLVRRQKV